MRSWIEAAWPRVSLHLFGRAPILVAGAGRSGTTWVAQTLAATLRRRLLFEPFLVNQQLEPCVGGNRVLDEAVLLRNYPVYISPDEKASRYDDALTAIVRGEARSPWIDQMPSPEDWKGAVIKDIRCNLMLGYLLKRFPTLSVLLIVRDPCDAVRSQIERRQSGWAFGLDPADLLGQERLMAEWLQPFADEIDAQRAPEELLALRWCVEHLVALRQVQGHRRALVVRYEELRRDEEAWHPIAERFDSDAWDWTAFREAVGRPSMTASGTPGSSLDARTRATIEALARRFGLEAFCSGVSRW